MLGVGTLYHALTTLLGAKIGSRKHKNPNAAGDPGDDYPSVGGWNVPQHQIPQILNHAQDLGGTTVDWNGKRGLVEQPMAG